MDDDLFDYIVQTLIQYADDAVDEEKKSKTEFDSGRVMAYYEVLDTIKNRLIIAEYDLSKCGLDINLEKRYS